MASDFSIAQFRFLERLLVVHGHWCYKRIAQMVMVLCNLVLACTINIKFALCVMLCMQICYFFYKNIAFGLTLFYFEAFTGFSGQSVYDDWYMLLFNVILTSLPVISLGVFEQDVSPEVCLQVRIHKYWCLHLIFHSQSSHFQFPFVVSCVVSARAQKLVLRLVQDIWVDGKWPLHFPDHFLPQYYHLLRSGLLLQRPNS